MTEYRFGENMTIEKFLHQIGGEVVDMVGYKTLFFADSEQARLFLGSRGYF